MEQTRWALTGRSDTCVTSTVLFHLPPCSPVPGVRVRPPFSCCNSASLLLSANTLTRTIRVCAAHAAPLKEPLRKFLVVLHLAGASRHLFLKKNIYLVCKCPEHGRRVSRGVGVQRARGECLGKTHASHQAVFVRRDVVQKAIVVHLHATDSNLNVARTVT